jgi:hypothetical protein
MLTVNDLGGRHALISFGCIDWISTPVECDHQVAAQPASVTEILSFHRSRIE